MPNKIDIRPVKRQADFEACEGIQQAAWRISAEGAVPAHILRAAAEHGGIVLGAFTPDDRLVGFVFSMISELTDERQQELAGSRFGQYSDMMGVHPDFQNRAIGTRLKWAQRAAALDRGYGLITWTYDPLLGPNAYINIVHLGVTCRRYIRDAYGELSGIYAGLNTDRFEVEWRLKSHRVRLLASQPEPPRMLEDWLGDGATIVNAAFHSDDRLTRPGPIDLPSSGLPLVEIPADFNAIRAADMALAREWRDHTREVFEAAFDQGYIVQRFCREGDRNFYVLWQEYAN